MSSSKQKYLTLDHRIAIQQGLDNNLSMVAISKIIGKNNSTVSKKIKRHHQRTNSNSFASASISCIHHESCTRTNVCPSNSQCHGKLCKRCNIYSSFGFIPISG